MQYTTQQLARAVNALLLLAALALLALATAPAAAAAGRVFVDPGHGGSFPGAVYGGVKEADINLAIALEVERILLGQGHATAMSRRTDTNVILRDTPTWVYDTTWRLQSNGIYNVYDDLQARCDRANAWGADVFVSIHANAAGSTSASGAETYWRDESGADRILSERLARYVQQEYVRETGLSDRGVKTSALYVLRWSNMPAILVETGFMSNGAERLKLADPAFQRRAARGIARGIDRFLAEDPFAALYPRWGGPNRYATATAVAQSGWPHTGGTVILASGTAWPDALAGTPLSRPMNAPLLLTRTDSLPRETAERIAAQSPARIVVLGGEGSVSATAVAEAVAATGRQTVEVDRIAGRNRYETAEAIARRVRVPASGRVIVASARSFADSLSVAPFAGAGRIPILLTERDAVPEATRRFLADNADGITHIDVIGGEGVIGPDVVAELRQTAPVTRVAGADRYQTNVAVVQRYRPTGDIAPMVVTGRSFPDALSAGALASRTNDPILLFASPGHLPARTREFLIGNEARVAEPRIVGGTGILPHQTEWMLRKALAR